MMDLQELKTQLEGANKADLYESIVNAIEGEKQRGISEVNKRNAENAKLRKFKQSMEALGYDGEADLDEFTSSLVDLRSQVNDKGNNSLTLKSLNSQIAKLTKDLETEKSLRLTAENKSKVEKINSQLLSTLQNKVYGADLLVKSLVAENKVDLLDNQVVFKDGDSVVNMDEGIKNLLETRKDIVRNTQSPGSNSHGTSNAVNPSIQAIMQSGDRNLIRQNIDAIRAELGLKK